jgi:RNA-directed DNA polymerase
MSTNYLSSRRSDRSNHWAAGYHFDQRQRRRAAERQRRALPPSGVPRLADIADSENLLRVFRQLRAEGGQAPGADNIGFKQLTITEVAGALRRVATAIQERRYRPHPTRSIWVPKASGGSRRLEIGTVCDRVVSAALYQSLSRIIDAQLLPGCFGFRPGLSVLHLLAKLERTMIEQDRYVVTTDDIVDAFGNVRIADALMDFNQIVADEGVRWLIAAVLHGDEGPLRTVGIDQGSPLSPAVLNLRLCVCLDQPYAAAPGNPLLLRWADDLACPASSVSDGRQALQRAADLLAPAGFDLKGTSGPPTNLRRQGAKVNYLGYSLGWRQGQMLLEIPSQAWTKLHTSLEQVLAQPNPWGNARGIIRGWLDVYGLAIGGEDVRAIVGRVMGVAADLGYRELGATTELEDAIRGSQARWERIRRRGSTHQEQ